MIHIAKSGDIEKEVNLSRRRFLSFLVGGAASAAMPTKTYAFFGNILRSPAIPVGLPKEWLELQKHLEKGIVFMPAYMLAK